MNSKAKDTADGLQREFLARMDEGSYSFDEFVEGCNKIAAEHIELERVFLESIVVPQIMYDFFEEMDDLVKVPVYNDHSVHWENWTEVFQERCKLKLGSIVSCLNNFVGRMNQGTPGISPARGNGKYLVHREGQKHLLSLACQLNRPIMTKVGPYIFVEDDVELDYEVCLDEVQSVYTNVSRYIKKEMLTYDMGDLYGVVLPETLP
jgi:hypothetical protein